MAETELFTKVEIVGEFYSRFFGTDNYSDAFETYDLGFPLAYATAVGIIDDTDESLKLINEAWLYLLDLTQTNIDEEGNDSNEDIGYSELDDLDLTGDLL
jgi:hypothetical protein